MTSPAFVQVRPKELSDWRQTVLFDPLEDLIHERLGKGTHAFANVAELFDALGIEHIDDGSLQCWNGCVTAIAAKRGTVYRMSYLQFGRLVHRMRTVRLRRHSWREVERELTPRYELIVS